MKMNKAVEEFYGEMILYSLYKENIKNLEFQLQLCYDALGGNPSSPPFDRIPAHSPPNKENEYQIRAKIDHLESMIKQKQDLINHCDVIMNQMSDFVRKAITLKFIEGLTWREVGKKMYKSKNGVEYTCKKEISRILHFGPQTKENHNNMIV